jgi:curved DNA-binding protein
MDRNAAAVQAKDYYQLLGVARGASAADIKKAYRKQARKFHPDMNQAGHSGHSMADINEARDVLSDPSKREAYDTSGTRRDDPAPPLRPSGDRFHPAADWADAFHFEPGADTPGNEANPGTFFEELFGIHRKGKAAAGPQRGQDRHASITLDLQDSYRGATRTLTLPVEGPKNPSGNPSGSASGSGAANGAQHGSTELQVSIPKGVFEGQHIRLAARGMVGTAGGASGDLLLEVHFKHDARWRTKGRDVFGALPLSPWEAVLNGWLVVQTPGGVAEVKIPAHWKAGRSLRLKGHGIPGNSASGPAHQEAGDLYLELEVALPPADSDHARAAYAAMALAFADFHPRIN